MKPSNKPSKSGHAFTQGCNILPYTLDVLPVRAAAVRQDSI